MRHLGEDKRDRAADGLLPIGDHAFDWHRQLFQLVFDFTEQGRQIALLYY